MAGKNRNGWQDSPEYALTKWGYSFDLVYDGKEAVEHAVENEGKYDICLMDIDMPYMGGYEATKSYVLKRNTFLFLELQGIFQLKINIPNADG